MNQILQNISQYPFIAMATSTFLGVVVCLVILSIYRERRKRAWQHQIYDLEKQNTILGVELGHVEKEADLLRTRLSETLAINQKLTNRDTEISTRIEENNKSFLEKEKLLRANAEMLRKEFEALSNKVLQSQGETISKKNADQLSIVLNPFKEQISAFRERIEQVHSNDNKDRASLLNELKNLQQASEKINLEASNLTKALKGDKKLQGNWGELVLETVLKESGLRSGHEYTTQMSLRNDAGELKRPDVIIHLPDDKDIVVDAKVSLIAYEKALSEEDEQMRKKYIQQHLQHLREQVKRLSDQNYERLKGVRSLDFVLLFLPIEPAFILAMEEDPSLFREAFAKRIMIVSPTTLMMTLRIIGNIWRYEQQNRNAQEIANRAGAIYDKLRGTLEDMESLGRALKTADKSFGAAIGKLATGKGNLVKRVEQIRELGATPKKPFSKTVLDEANQEIETEIRIESTIESHLDSNIDELPGSELPAELSELKE